MRIGDGSSPCFQNVASQEIRVGQKCKVYNMIFLIHSDTDLGLAAALLTMRIRNLWEHLQRQKSDRGNRPRLAKIVHHRARILKYLKSISRQRYNDILPRLGLEPERVEGELKVKV